MPRDNIIGAADVDELVSAIMSGEDEPAGEIGLTPEAIIGATVRAMRRQQASGGGVPAQPVAAPHVAGRPTAAEDWREQAMAFPSLELAPGASGTITAKPQRLCRIDVMVVNETVEGAGLINQFDIGRESQMVTAGEMPVSAFGPLAIDKKLKGATADRGTEVVIGLKNAGTTTVTFSAVGFCQVYMK